MSTRLVALVLVGGLALGAAACGAGEDGDALTKTATKLDDIRSGVLTLRLVAASGGAAEPGEEVGFGLAGPFSFESTGPLPVAELEYSRIRGADRTSHGFTSTGHKAYVKSGGAFYEIPEDRWDGLRLDPGEGDAGLSQLRIDRWVIDGEVAEEGEVAGVRVEVIRGELDVAAALTDVLALARQLGVPDEDSPATIAEAAAQHLRRAVRSATAEVVTGRTDRLLRRLAFEVVFAAEDDALRPALGALAGGRLALDLRIDDPNKQVTVAEPIGARPIGQLQRKR